MLKNNITRPHEEIPELIVRSALSRQYGIKPEEVTSEQIKVEVSRLLDDYPAVRVVPSQPVSVDAPKPSNPITVAGKKTFPNRAAWVRDRLKERDWDWNDPNRFGGPDRKTVQKLLAGKYVQIRALTKLVVALNRKKKGDAIRILDVPND